MIAAANVGQLAESYLPSTHSACSKSMLKCRITVTPLDGKNPFIIFYYLWANSGMPYSVRPCFQGSHITQECKGSNSTVLPTYDLTISPLISGVFLKPSVAGIKQLHKNLKFQLKKKVSSLYCYGEKLGNRKWDLKVQKQEPKKTWKKPQTPQFKGTWLMVSEHLDLAVLMSQFLPSVIPVQPHWNWVWHELGLCQNFGIHPCMLCCLSIV